VTGTTDWTEARRERGGITEYGRLDCPWSFLRKLKMQVVSGYKRVCACRRSYAQLALNGAIHA